MSPLPSAPHPARPGICPLPPPFPAPEDWPEPQRKRRSSRIGIGIVFVSGCFSSREHGKPLAKKATEKNLVEGWAETQDKPHVFDFLPGPPIPFVMDSRGGCSTQPSEVIYAANQFRPANRSEGD